MLSLARGILGVVAPIWFARMAGTRPAATRTRLLLGVREIVIGAGLLAAEAPRPFLQARFGGDLFDVALHTRELLHRPSSPRTAAALVLVVVTAVADFWLLADD